MPPLSGCSCRVLSTSAFVLATLFATVSLRSEVTFSLSFEPGYWHDSTVIPSTSTYYEPGRPGLTYGTRMQEEMQASLDSFGVIFADTATVEISITDVLTDDASRQWAFGSAGATAVDPITRDGRTVYVTNVFNKIVNGVDSNGTDAEATINWNFKPGNDFGGNVNWDNRIFNVKGLARHEFLHPLGMSSWLSSITRTTTGDGNNITGVVLSDKGAGPQDFVYFSDLQLFDINDDPLLSWSASDNKYVLSDYAVDDLWFDRQLTGGNNAGVYFRGGNGEKLQLDVRVSDIVGFDGLQGNSEWWESRSTSTTSSLDFAHVDISAYPFRNELNENDEAFLRGLGYQLTNDLACDFDVDGDCDGGDLDVLYGRFGDAGGRFDLDGNGTVNGGDISEWLAEASDSANPYLNGAKTFLLGDVNLDGDVNSVDLGLLLNKFNDGSGLLFGLGNLNDDANVDSIDLGLLLNNFNYQSSSVHSVPEPNAAVLVIVALVGCLWFVFARRKSQS